MSGTEFLNQYEFMQAQRARLQKEKEKFQRVLVDNTPNLYSLVAVAYRKDTALPVFFAKGISVIESERNELHSIFFSCFLRQLKELKPLLALNSKQLREEQLSQYFNFDLHLPCMCNTTNHHFLIIIKFRSIKNLTQLMQPLLGLIDLSQTMRSLEERNIEKPQNLIRQTELFKKIFELARSLYQTISIEYINPKTAWILEDSHPSFHTRIQASFPGVHIQTVSCPNQADGWSCGDRTGLYSYYLALGETIPAVSDEKALRQETRSLEAEDKKKEADRTKRRHERTGKSAETREMKSSSQSDSTSEGEETLNFALLTSEALEELRKLIETLQKRLPKQDQPEEEKEEASEEAAISAPISLPYYPKPDTVLMPSAPQEAKPFQHAFFSSTVIGIILAGVTVVILSETLPATAIGLLSGLWGLLGIAIAGVLLLNTLLWLTLWALHLSKENSRVKPIPSPTPVGSPAPASQLKLRSTPSPQLPFIGSLPLTLSAKDKPSFQGG